MGIAVFFRINKVVRTRLKYKAVVTADAENSMLPNTLLPQDNIALAIIKVTFYYLYTCLPISSSLRNPQGIFTNKFYLVRLS